MSNPAGNFTHAPGAAASARASAAGLGDQSFGSRLRSEAVAKPAGRRSGSTTKKQPREATASASATNTQCGPGLLARFARAHRASSKSRSLASTRSPASDSSNASEPSPQVTSWTGAPGAIPAMRFARSRATTSRVACSSPRRVRLLSRPEGKRALDLRRSSNSSAACRASSGASTLRSDVTTSSGWASGANAATARSISAVRCSSPGSTSSRGYSVRSARRTESRALGLAGRNFSRLGRRGPLATVRAASNRSMGQLGPCPAAEEGGSLSWGGIE